MPHTRGSGAIYFARAASGQIKIGCSGNAGWRVYFLSIEPNRTYYGISGIDTSRMTLLLTVSGEGGFGRECALHRRFAAESAHFRSREWFSGPDIEACVAELLARAGERRAA